MKLILSLASTVSGSSSRPSSARPSSRPRTPPSSTSHKGRNSDVSSPPLQKKSGPSTPPIKSYISFLSNTNQDWNAEDPEGDDMYGYEDDDGDDFGLPSLSNMKRKNRRMAAAQGKAADPSTSTTGFGSSFGFHSRRYSDSADIAIERPMPAYPMPKKSEGKILRPQYKDILKGETALARAQ